MISSCCLLKNMRKDCGNKPSARFDLFPLREKRRIEIEDRKETVRLCSLGPLEPENINVFGERSVDLAGRAVQQRDEMAGSRPHILRAIDRECAKRNCPF